VVTRNKSWPETRIKFRDVNDNSGFGGVSSSDKLLFVASRNTIGFGVEGYKRKIARREAASSAYTRTSLELTQNSPLKIDWSRFNNFVPAQFARESVKGEEAFVFVPTGMPIVSTALHNAALEGFVGKLRNAQRSLQGAVVAGELGKTIKMIASPARALRDGMSDYLRSVKKRCRSRRQLERRRGRPKDLNKIVSGTWLEYQMGWRPLMHDVKDGAQALSKLIHNFGSGVRRVSHYERGQQETAVYPGATWSAPSWGSVTLINTLQQECEVKYTAAIKVPLPRDVWWDTLGIGWGDFVPTIWELIPFSFVADYFLNVGTIFNALSILKTDFVHIDKSVKATRKGYVEIGSVQKTFFPPGVYSNEDFSTSGGTSEVTSLSYIRNSVTVGSLVPTIQFSMPGTNTRWMNLGALFAQSADVTRDILGNSLY